MKDLSELQFSLRVLQLIHYAEWLLFALCLLSLAYFVFGKFSAVDLLPGRKELWNGSWAVQLGVSTGLAYALVHLVHLGTYSTFKNKFIKVTTTIDKYYHEKGFVPLPPETEKFIGIYKKYLEPNFYAGSWGIRINILIGFLVVLMSLTLGKFVP